MQHRAALCTYPQSKNYAGKTFFLRTHVDLAHMHMYVHSSPKCTLHYSLFSI